MKARRLLYILPALLFAALAAAFWQGIGRDPSLVPSALLNQPAPSFDLPPLVDGKPGLARADLAGKPVLVNIFASWCVPCRAEHPLLVRLAAQGVAIYGIDYKDKPDAARDWLKTLGDPYQRIGEDASGRAAIDWGVYGVPESFVIDAAGTIRFKQVGPMTAEAVAGIILPLLKKLAK